MNLVFRGATVEGQRTPVDIAIAGDRIAAIGPGLPAGQAIEYDAAGMLASPLFIDPHQHLDCAFLSERTNQSGTLREAIAINAELKQSRSHDEVCEKACRAVEEAILYGTGWMRSHVDVDSVSKLDLLHAVLEVRDKYRGLLDIQVVAFPQLGYVADREAPALVRAAMREGADLVGGIPAHEAGPEDAARHVEIAFEIAEEFGADIDMHIDETDDPGSRTLELFADAAHAHRYQGRATAGHCCALAAYDDVYAARVIEKVAGAGMHVITSPLVNLYLQGRADRQPVRRGITRVKELMAAGVNVSCGLDDLKNIFLPFGRADMLDGALVTALAAHLSTPEEIQAAFDMPRAAAARILRLAGYGLRPGGFAEFTLFRANDAQEALRVRPPRRFVVRRGRIIAETRYEERLYLEPQLERSRGAAPA